MAYLVPLGGPTLLDINHCLNRKLTRVRRPNAFQLLINNEVVHYFVLPHHEQRSFHNCDNWIYQLEGQREAPTPPQTRPEPAYHPAPLLDISSLSSCIGPLSPHGHNIDYEHNALQREVTCLLQALQDQTDRMAEQLDHLYQEVYSLSRVLDLVARHCNLWSFQSIPFISIFTEILRPMFRLSVGEDIFPAF